MNSIYNTILLAEKSLEELYYQGKIIENIDNNIENIENNITISEKIVKSMKSLYSRMMYNKNNDDVIQMSKPIYDVNRQKDNEHFDNNPLETLKIINLKINESPCRPIKERCAADLILSTLNSPHDGSSHTVSHTSLLRSLFTLIIRDTPTKSKY